MNLKNNKNPFEHPLILGSITPVSKIGIDHEVDYFNSMIHKYLYVGIYMFDMFNAR